MSFRTVYQQKLDNGQLIQDPGHARGLDALTRLETELNTLGEPAIPLPFFKPKNPRPKGVYLWGPVGRGKSTLMDIFFDSAPIDNKRRVHFHRFMKDDVHAPMTQWRKAGPAERKMLFGSIKGDDPIPALAAKIFADAHLLCFDEFQVTDIADAMILGRLFTALFDEGAIVVATSNRQPDDLYKDGLNRQHILPFIETLKSECEVVAIDGDTDHRLKGLRGASFFAPINSEMEAAFDTAWAKASDGQDPGKRTLDVGGRTLVVNQSAGRVARMTFAGVCEAALGANDYMKLAETYDALFISHIPVLGPEHRNAAKRLVTLVDTFYESKKRLVCLAAAEPFGLYTLGDGAFEFQRTASRLHEMRSAGWGKS